MRFIATAVILLCSTQLSAEVTPWVDIDIRDGHIYIPSTTGGISGHSYIDSGERHNAINARFLAANDIHTNISGRRKVRGLYEIERRLVHSGVSTELFGTRLEMNNLTELDLPGQTQLLLGAPFLDGLIFQFDYPNKRMRAFSHDSIDMPSLQNIEAKRDVYNGQTIVKVRMNDAEDVWLVLDTGNDGGILLQRKVASRAGWLDRYPSERIHLSDVNASGAHDSFALPSIRLGPFEVEQARVTVPIEGQELPMFERQKATSTHTKTARRKSRGLLGYDVLKHFIVTLDYRNAAVHLALPEDMAKPTAPGS